VARHGGDVRVASAVGAGTTVTLQLPSARLTHAHGPLLAPAHPASVSASPTPPVDLGADLHTRSVLVVDDDPAFRAVFARRLALDARRVEIAGDARAALLLLEAGRWDLICIDEGLPDGSGRELAAEIRRRGLAGAVILVTGGAAGPDDPHLLTDGVDAVLPKPCSDPELAHAIRTAVAQDAARPATPA
jgi:CheY-like chemotaxis protein